MTLNEAVKVTYAMIGQELSDLQLAMTVKKLEAYPAGDVMIALSRCQDEVKRSLSFADILDRMPGGRPKAEEAWAMVSKALNNEQVSIVWTEEMASAFGVAAPLADDPVAARMAFKETYMDLVNQARVAGAPIRWTVSLGWDKAGREVALREAEQKQRLTHEYVERLLPPSDDISDPDLRQIVKALT